MRPEDIFKIEDSIEVPEANTNQSEVTESNKENEQSFDFNPNIKKEITLEDLLEILKKFDLELDEKTVNQYYEQIIFQQKDINNITETIHNLVKEKEILSTELKENPQNNQLLKKFAELERKIIELNTEERIKEDDVKSTITSISNIFEENIKYENLNQNQITEKNDKIFNFKNSLYKKINENYQNKTITEVNLDTHNKIDDNLNVQENINQYKENVIPEENNNSNLENMVSMETNNINLENVQNIESYNELPHNAENVESENNILENAANTESQNEVLENAANTESQNEVLENAANTESNNISINESILTESNINAEDSQTPLSNNNETLSNSNINDEFNMVYENQTMADESNQIVENLESVENSYDYNMDSLLSYDSENLNYNDSATNDYSLIAQNTQKTNEMVQGLSEMIRQGFETLSITLQSMPMSQGSEESYGSPPEMESHFEDNPQVYQQNLLSDYRKSLRSNYGLETFMGYSTELKANNLGSYL